MSLRYLSKSKSGPRQRPTRSEAAHDPDMFIDLGEDLFLPGYPLGFAASGFLQFGRRASLASSLEVGQE